MIITKHGIIVEDGDKIDFEDLCFYFPEGVNPLGVLDFMGIKIERRVPESSELKESMI